MSHPAYYAKVLLVEDNPYSRAQWENLLVMEGIPVLCADTAQGAIDLLKKDPAIAYVALDHELKDHSLGGDVAHFIGREMGQDRPVVVNVSADTPRMYGQAAHYGKVGFLELLLDPNGMETVKRVLRTHEGKLSADMKSPAGAVGQGDPGRKPHP